MEFNVFVFVVQIINFLILVYILKRFLYRPILGAIKNREMYIKKTIDDANESKLDFEKSKARYEERLANLDRDKEHLRSKMYHEIETERKHKIAEVKKEVNVWRDKIRLQIESEKRNFLGEMLDALYKKFSVFTDKALRELSGKSSQEHVMNLFFEKVENLSVSEVATINNKLLESNGVIVFSSFHVIDDETKIELENLFKQKEIKFDRIEYKTEPKLLMGVEMKVGSYYLLWNLETYLSDFKMEVEKILNSKSF